METAPLDLVAAALRADPERARPALLAPAGPRPILLALVLLNQEWARVPETVSQPMPGLIRLQWWRDGIDAAAEGGAPPPHPLLDALKAPLAAGRLRAQDLHAMIEAREAELEGLAPENLDELAAYVDATAGTLQRTWIDALAPPSGGGPWREAAAAAGRAFGLLGVVRAIGHQAAMRRVLLPRDLLASAAIAPETIIARQGEERLSRVVERVVERAEAAIGEVARAGKPPAALMPAFLILGEARRHAGALRRAGFSAEAAARLAPPPFAGIRHLGRLLARRP
ncbi:MAG: squalene/phytoene synthase family protein [Geminicoccaceae bacterium]|nr:squalene/phytoene synthase family protein [Geminicoccaceae bacterium]